MYFRRLNGSVGRLPKRRQISEYEDVVVSAIKTNGCEDAVYEIPNAAMYPGEERIPLHESTRMTEHLKEPDNADG